MQPLFLYNVKYLYKVKLMVANAKVNKNVRFKDCTRQCNHIHQNEGGKNSHQTFHQHRS